MRPLLAVLVFALPLVAAPVPKAKKTTEQKLLGKWRMVQSDGGKPKGYEFYVTFKEDGVLELRREYGGDVKDTVWTGTYQVIDGEMIKYEVISSSLLKAETLTIDKLTDDEVSWTDPDKKTESLERVKEK